VATATDIGDEAEAPIAEFSLHCFSYLLPDLHERFKTEFRFFKLKDHYPRDTFDEHAVLRLAPRRLSGLLLFCPLFHNEGQVVTFALRNYEHPVDPALFLVLNVLPSLPVTIDRALHTIHEQAWPITSSGMCFSRPRPSTRTLN
jgi:hypothetical protein